jgi:hypothetical protein
MRWSRIIPDDQPVFSCLGWLCMGTDIYSECVGIDFPGSWSVASMGELRPLSHGAREMLRLAARAKPRRGK